MSGATCIVCGYLFAPAWGRQVCSSCEFGARVPRRAAKPAARVTWPDAELLARARRHKPIPAYKEVPPKDWQDTAQADPWGARPRGHQVLNRTWAGGNCLKACIASVLNAPIERVPDPSVEYNEGPEGGLSVTTNASRPRPAFGLSGFRAASAHPKDVRARSGSQRSPLPDHDADHVVVARGYYTVHDPLGEFTGSLPWDRIIDGMIVQPTTRVVPVLSPHGNGRMVVAA